MDQEPVIVTCVLPAPADVVWKALTDQEEMKYWYFQIEDFRAEPGFAFQFWESDAHRYLHKCRVTEVIAGKKLSYSWRFEGYAGESLLTFELSPQGKNTVLKLTHAGLETFPPDVPELAKENFREGWNQIINTSLRKYIESL